MKIVVNKCSGGFSLSKEVYKELGIEWDGYGYLSNEALGIEDDDDNRYRQDEKLIAAVEKLGVEKSSGSMAYLEILDIPDGIGWELDDYGGIESIHESHRSW